MRGIGARGRNTRYSRSKRLKSSGFTLFERNTVPRAKPAAALVFESVGLTHRGIDISSAVVSLLFPLPSLWLSAPRNTYPAPPAFSSLRHSCFPPRPALSCGRSHIPYLGEAPA